MIYRYYSTMRPVAPGTFPKKRDCEIHNYDERIEIDGLKAWGYIDYPEPLTEKEAHSYELEFGGIFEAVEGKEREDV